jgi:hypothetical protein
MDDERETEDEFTAGEEESDEEDFVMDFVEATEPQVQGSLSLVRKNYLNFLSFRPCKQSPMND